MSNPIKFTDEELKAISDLQTEYQNNILKFGQLQIRKYMLEDEAIQVTEHEETLKKEYIEIQNKESDLLNKFTEKYGEGSLNAKDGIFIPKAK